VTYRQRLFDISLELIERDPWIGSVNYLSTPEMMQLIQGEGIIDLVNTYIQIALFSGLVGLGLFAGCFGAILIGLRRVIKIHGRRNYELTNCARILLASLVAILVTVGTVSSQDFIPFVYWSFAGLSAALIRISSQQRALAAAQGAHAGFAIGRAPAHV
jgi:O-antigen ligase